MIDLPTLRNGGLAGVVDSRVSGETPAQVALAKATLNRVPGLVNSFDNYLLVGGTAYAAPLADAAAGLRLAATALDDVVFLIGPP